MATSRAESPVRPHACLPPGRPGALLAVLALLGALGCQQGPEEGAPTLLRLNPTAVQAEAALQTGALFDRDTTSGVVLQRPVTLTLSYAQDVQPQRLKVFARGPVKATLGGAPALEVQGAGAWESLTATGLPAALRTVTLTLTPLASEVRVEEVELWGPGQVRSPEAVQQLAERSRETSNLGLTNVHVFPAQPAEATLTPRGMAEGTPCATFSLAAPLPLGTVRRAHLVYEAQGLQRPVVLRRSLNGQPAQGGLWLGAGARVHTLADELNPEWLTGQEKVTLCLPDEATGKVALSGVRLLLEQDDGSQPFPRETALRLGAALDGDARTSALVSAGALELLFARPISVDSVVVDVDTPADEATSSVHDGTTWQELGPVALARGRNALALEGLMGRGVRLAFGAARRPDVPAASVAELVVTGSGVGPRLGASQLVITSPALRPVGEALSAEHFSGRAYLSGWAESPAGRGVVEVDGVPVDNGDGSFGVALQRPEKALDWHVTLTARFPDGSEVRRVVRFDRDAQSELDAEAVGESGSDGAEEVLFGAEEQTAWGRVDAAKGGKVRLGERAEFDAPPGAVDGPVNVGITRKMPEALPPLDPGMVNVTAPLNAGYRFSPPGQKFKKPVTIRLPYDATLLPEGVPPEQVQTFFFDKAVGQWKPLVRKQVLRATRQVESETTHFTFMINAVLVLPDHPGPVSFDPTSIKDLKAADPSANIELIGPPEGNNQGTARLGTKLHLPGARGPYAPGLQLSYDSATGNGWVGVGWDLSVSSVQVDTRFGAPFYDGSERFVLDGEQLVPLATEGPCVGGGTGKRFAARVEKSFRRVVRCGDHFEVAQQDGVLFLYGVTPGARLADPADGTRIAQWMLERVVDAHGNLALYRYTEDRRKQPGTAFDTNNGEDFRQLYPREILYSGKVDRAAAARDEASFLAAATMGPYLVQLELERSGSALKERPDIITSGRMGFKTVTRYRLGRVKVRLNTAQEDTLIREYRFVYEAGDFGKSRLKTVEQYGVGGVAGGALFHSHGFEYQSVDDHGASAFSEVVTYPFENEDEDAMTASKEWAVGAHAYAGIGFTFNKQNGSVGGRVGFNHRESTTHASLLDLNGDGLLDRVTQRNGQLRVQLNDGQNRWMSPVAPGGDPFAGGALAPILGTPALGAESGDSVNAAIQATFASFSANVGVTNAWSTSRDFTMDADGDGLVDFVSGGNVYFNQQRGTGACPASTFCFSPSKPVSGTLDFSNLGDAQDVFASDPALAEAAQQAERDFHPTDALLEWTAPFAGTVDVSGTLAWMQDRNPAVAGADGVRLRVYRNSALLAEYVKAATDASPTAVSRTGVTVRQWDRLYFVLSTLKNVSIDTTTVPPVPLEEVRFAPVVRYTQCTEGCGGVRPADATLEDPTGASLFTFDAQKDFRLAGEPLVAVQVPRAGTLHLSGGYLSAGAADDVRLCVQRFGPTERPLPRPCSAGDVLFRGYPGGTGNEQFDVPLQVQNGESLVFRMETDLPIDPDSVQWDMEGQMTEVCDAAGTCAPPAPRDVERLHFRADPYLPLHPQMEDRPLRSLVVPRDGTLHLSSTVVLGSGNQFFTARMKDRLVFKHRSNESRTVSLPVLKGQQILFQAHSPSYSDPVEWAVDAALEVPAADGGVERIALEAPLHFTNELYIIPLTSQVISPPRSPFGGGHHGWRYGLWGGRPARDGKPEEAFDSALFYTEAKLDLGEGSDRDKFHNGKGQVRDEESDVARRIRLFAPLVPRRLGTQLMAEVPGLKPTPAYVSQDGTAFIAQGTMHGGHKGVLASGADGSARTVDASFRIGETSRASTTQSIAAGIGASLGPASLSLNVSTGRTSQRMDVRDMNGDGIMDVVVNGQAGGNGVRLTHLRKRTLRQQVAAAGTHLSESHDLTATVGMGLSSPVPQVSAKGRVKGMEGMFPTGFSVGVGAAATLSATDMDLVDVNGDGLSDQVRRDGTAFRVRLNLGSRFAASEDLLPVGAWAVDGPFDPLVDKLGGTAPPDGADEEEVRGHGDAMSVLESLASPDVVRRSTAVTLEGNLGLTIAEDYGVTANWASSLNGTQVVLADVTGDGLPDYVRKSSAEKAFRVKVNRGFGFGPEEVWPVPAWPTGVTSPRFKVNPALDASIIPLLGLKDGVDTVEASGSHSRIPSVGFVFTVPILLSPFGTPWLHLSFGADVTPERVSGFELGLMDVNGDGLADHVLKTEQTTAPLGSQLVPGGGNAVYARVNGYAGSNLLTKVNRPLGGSFTLGYRREGNTVDMPESRYVLASVVMEDGTGSSAPGHALRTEYTYAGGRYDRAERDFYGFTTVTRLNPDASRVIQTFATDGVIRKGLLLQEETRDANGKLYAATLNTFGPPTVLAAPQAECTAYVPFFLSAADVCASSFTPLLRVEKRLYEGQTDDVALPGMASAQVMQYDARTGNIVLFEDLGDLADATDDLHARVEYASSTALTALHHQKLVAKLEVREGPAASPRAVLRRREGDYDAHGSLIRQLAHIGEGRAAETLLTWNADGMLESMTSPPNARGQRYVLKYEYEPVTRSMVSVSTDAFGYRSVVEHDLRFQETRRTTDIAGNVMEREYDAFGRLSRVWGPYEVGGSVPTIEVAYDTAARPAWAMTRNLLQEEGGDGRLDTVVFVDGLARYVQTKKDAQIEGGIVGMSVTGHIAFDVMGRPVEKGQTFFDMGPKTRFVPGSPLNPTTDTLDLLGRVVRTVGPDGSTTRVSYDFATPQGTPVRQVRATVTDPLGNVRVLYRDVADRVTAVEEHIEGRRPTTRYETDALGQLVRIVDAAGNATLYTYDLLGRRTSLSDPDTGLTELRYDDASNLVERVDPSLRAAGQAIRYEHDYHRVVRIDHPVSDDVTYEYGPPGAPENGAGRIVRIADEVGEETRGYGRLGEVVRATRGVRAFRPGDRPRTFTTRFGYDSFGRMMRVLYPDGELLRYTYDAGGLLRTATGYRPGSPHAPAETQVYLRSLEYDAFGQRTSMVLGNGVATRYAYEPLTRRLATLTTRAPRGRILQALTYSYDRIGNVTGMVNALGQPVGNRSGAVSFAFGYDALYRLTSAKGTALARPGLVDRFDSSFSYDDVHNMRRKTQVHELLSSRTGDPNAARPDHSNHDDVYEYGGAGPHRATRIGDTLLTYDLNGNTLVECRTVNGTGCADTGEATPSPQTHDHYRRYVWTETNTLRAVVDGGGGNATRFFYDAEGERVVKLGRGGTSLSIGQFFSVKGKRHGTKHIFAGPTRLASKLLPVPDGDIGFDAPVAEQGSTTGTVVLASASGPAAENDSGCVPSDNQPQKCPVVVVDPVGGDGSEPAVRPATFYYHPDHLGSTSWVTDQQGRVHEHVEYFPFGEVWRDKRHDDDGAPVRAPNFLFSGKEFDEETGLSYFGARYYDARKARWISPDPFREEWGDQPPPVLMSLYAYANHSPLGWKDPTGKAPEWLHAALDVAGMVPVIGEVADGANALIYLSEGRYVEAGISAMGMIPVLGEAGKAGKWVAKGVKAGAGELAQKAVAKELRSEFAEQGSKKFVKEAKECLSGACGVPGKKCFVAGTLITTDEGLKPIEEVREGDLVLSRDDATGAVDWRPVLATIVTPGARVIDVTLRADDGTRETFGVTADHPFWVEGRGWTEAGQLVPGSRIRTASDAWLTTESVAETLARATVYNFEVADFHTYFVGAGQAWVHNNGCTPTPSPGSSAKKVPNPNGKKGGPAHQAKVDDVAAQVEARGLEAKRELMVPTPNGQKGKRFVDVAGVDPKTGKVVEMHQVGRQTKGGNPVSRERKAMDDIQGATGQRPQYHPYN